MKLALYAALLSGLPAYIHAQVLVEAGVLTGATATSAGAAGNGIGKSLSSAFANAEKTLKSAAQPQAQSPPEWRTRNFWLNLEIRRGK